MAGNDVIFNRIAEALLIDYASVCYVNAGTGEYEWYSLDPDFRSLQIEQGGRDFFSDIAQIARSVVHPDDQHIFTNDMRKDRLLSAVKEGRMQSVAFRMLIGGKPVYHRLRLIRKASDNEDYFVLGAINIEKEMRIKQSAERFEREREQFNQIAHSLASHYDTIYYVDMETNHYIEFSSTDIYKQMRVPPGGQRFLCRVAQKRGEIRPSRGPRQGRSAAQQGDPAEKSGGKKDARGHLPARRLRRGHVLPAL
jgi:hypothetical protein